MKRIRLTVFNVLPFLAVAVTLIGFGVAEAQRSSLTITDAQGKEVIVYSNPKSLSISWYYCIEYLIIEAKC